MATAEEQRRYQREWLKRRRDRWILANGPCRHCGSTLELQVDHVDANEKVSHRVWSWARARREAELAKCQVLCSPCHKAKTGECGDNSRGSAIGNSKLDEMQVAEARALHAAGGKTFREIGDMFGVHRDTIRYFVNRGGWAHVS